MIRQSDYPIADLILSRWSPRAMSGQAITEQELMTLFEAARWAPSSYNNQPWHFIYAMRDTDVWHQFLNVIVPSNQIWAQQAAALVVLCSRNNFFFNDKPSRTHTLDAGAAWQNLALQGYQNGLVIHGMEGFDYNTVQSELKIPADYTVEMMIAIGKPGNKAELPPELQAKEEPSDRRALNTFVSEGSFKK